MFINSWNSRSETTSSVLHSDSCSISLEFCDIKFWKSTFSLATMFSSLFFVCSLKISFERFSFDSFSVYFRIFLEVPDNALVGHLAMLIYNCIHNHSQRKSLFLCPHCLFIFYVLISCDLNFDFFWCCRRELLERKEGVSLLQHFLRHVQQEEMGQQQSTQHEWMYVFSLFFFFQLFE